MKKHRSVVVLMLVPLIFALCFASYGQIVGPDEIVIVPLPVYESGEAPQIAPVIGSGEVAFSSQCVDCIVHRVQYALLIPEGTLELVVRRSRQWSARSASSVQRASRWASELRDVGPAPIAWMQHEGRLTRRVPKVASGNPRAAWTAGGSTTLCSSMGDNDWTGRIPLGRMPSRSSMIFAR